MAIFENSIIINAPLNLVRNVFVDFPAWPEWNPLYAFLNVLNGDINIIGSIVVIQTAVKLNPLVVTAVIGSSGNTLNAIEWSGCVGWSSFQSFSVANLFVDVSESADCIRTEYRRVEVWTGMFAGLAGFLTGASLRDGADSMCKALKRRCKEWHNQSKTIDHSILAPNVLVPLNECDVINWMIMALEHPDHCRGAICTCEGKQCCTQCGLGP